MHGKGHVARFAWISVHAWERSCDVMLRGFLWVCAGMGKIGPHYGAWLPVGGFEGLIRGLYARLGLGNLSWCYLSQTISPPPLTLKCPP